MKDILGKEIKVGDSVVFGSAVSMCLRNFEDVVVFNDSSN